MSEATAGSATGKTTQTFLTALITNSALLGIELVAFVLLKNRLSRIYSPRTYLPPPEKRAEALPRGPWKWLPAIVVTPAEDVIRKNGLDAYMFLRFLRLMIIIFASFTLVTWLVLLPVNTAGMQGNEVDGLNKLSWGNIPADQSKRYAAHIIIVYILTFWVLYLIRLEYFHYTHMRQAYLSSKSHSHLPQARTVLITSIPHEICSEKELRIWSSFVPGGVQNIWVYRGTMELNKAYDERLEACNKLEAAESKILRDAIKAKQKRDESRAKATHHTRSTHSPPVTAPPRDTPGHGITTPTRDSQLTPDSPHPPTPQTKASSCPAQLPGPLDLETARYSSRSRIRRERALLDELVPCAQRPRHRLGFLGLWGHKVDTIEHCKNEIARLNVAIGDMRKRTDEAKPLGSAFIQCNLQLGAHVLAQCVSYHEPMKMSYKWIQVAPKDVIWANIDDGIYETRVRYVTSWMASIGIIVLWFFPVTFVGLLSNISQLCQKVSWLAWVCRAPTPVPGILQGILPPLILAILFAVLPLILRALAWYENIPLYSLLSISVYKRYYLFLVVHGFLVVTLSSGITATASDIVNAPTKAVSELASHLPDASVFFLTWTVTQGLTGAGGALLQIATLLMHYVKKWFLGRTPRQAYAVTFIMPTADFGTVLPQMSLLATIGFAYSVLSPIINGLATLAFVLFYFAWKFLLTWVFDQPDEQETGGLYFPIAMQNLFVGLYIEQICLAALFFLKASGGHTFLGPAILMLLLLVITLTAQIFLAKAFEPLSQYLPMSLATKKMHARVERERRRHESAEEVKEDEEIDLFNRDHIKSVVRKRIVKPAQDLTAGGLSLLKPPMHVMETPPEASGSFMVRDLGYTPSKQLHLSPSRDSHLSSSSRPPSDEKPDQAPHASFTPPPAPAAATKHIVPPDPGEDLDFDDHGFDHPSSYAEQPWIWLPQDELGLSEVLVAELRACGVDASDEGSFIDREGTVEVMRTPPDEAWVGGHNA